MIRGSVAFAALSLTRHPLSIFGFPDPEEGAELIPFLDQQAGTNGIQWEKLTSWLTPNKEVYQVQHYGVPKVDLQNWKLEISGLVRKPKTLTLDDLKKRRRRTITATLECSGNNNGPGFMGAVGNV